jgi:hypothetical protein
MLSIVPKVCQAIIKALEESIQVYCTFTCWRQKYCGSIDVRDLFSEYFISPVGSVEWQRRMTKCGFQLD